LNIQWRIVVCIQRSDVLIKEPIHDIVYDFEFAQRLFGELNRDLLGPPDDGKVIILSNSDEEKEEAHEEKSTGVKDAVTSVAVNPVSTTSADDIVTIAENSSTHLPPLLMPITTPGWNQMIVVTVWPQV
jgi:hypothetical protein